MTRKIEIKKKVLEEMYQKNNLSTHKIAKIFKCNPTVIQKRLKEYRIKPRHPKEKIILNKERLYDLYINKKLSIQKMADILKISSCTAYYKIRELSIQTRKKNIIKVTKEELENLYLNKKLSCSKIANLYNCDSVTIFKRLKEYDIKTRTSYETNIKYERKQFDGDELLKAYMIGFRLGDLNITKKGKDASIILKTSTTREEQLELVKEIYGKYGYFYFKKYGDVYSMTFLLDRISFDFLLKKEDNIDNWIIQNKDNFLAFVGGYSDAEGSFGVYQNKARFRLGTYDKNILSQIQEKLINLGINTKFRLETKAGTRKQNQDFYRISINEKASLLRFIQLIKSYTRHTKRYNDLLSCESNILERNKKQENNNQL